MASTLDPTPINGSPTAAETNLPASVADLDMKKALTDVEVLHKIWLANKHRYHLVELECGTKEPLLIEAHYRTAMALAKTKFNGKALDRLGRADPYTLFNQKIHDGRWPNLEAAREVLGQIRHGRFHAAVVHAAQELEAVYQGLLPLENRLRAAFKETRQSEWDLQGGVIRTGLITKERFSRLKLMLAASGLASSAGMAGASVVLFVAGQEIPIGAPPGTASHPLSPEFLALILLVLAITTFAVSFDLLKKAFRHG